MISAKLKYSYKNNLFCLNFFIAARKLQSTFSKKYKYKISAS